MIHCDGRIFPRRIARACWLALLALLSPLACAEGHDLAIVGATIIDLDDAGTSTHDRPDATILIRNGRISAVGDRRRIVLPHGIRIIDATGRYVVPGLIDGFGSMRNQRFADAYLYEGVTTVDVTRSPAGGDGERVIAETSRGPRLLRGATVSGFSLDGSVPTTHPWTEHRLHDRRLSAAELIREIDQMADRGDRNLLIGFDVLPDQLEVILHEAKRRHLATSIEAAFTRYPDAIRAGVDTLLRNDRYQTSLVGPQELLAYADDPTGIGARGAYRAVCDVDPESPTVLALGRQLATSRTALMPILSIEATADDVGAPNPWLAPSSVFMQPGDLDDPVDPKTGARPYLASHPDRWRAIQACAKHRQDIDGSLRRHGAIFLAGSGAPAFGIMPGGGMHQELRLLQHIGLTPREALAAATTNFAHVFGWRDIGRIGTGRAGDVLVLNSDPRLDVSAVDDLQTVIHDGEVVDRDVLRSRALVSRESTVQLTVDAPTLFAPEAIWPAGSDASPAFTPDGQTVFFTHAVGPSRTIMVSHLHDGAWSQPQPASFSGTWRDIEPAMAPDGSYLVFISNRPATAGGEPLTGFWGGQPRPGAGGNIWRVNRVGDGWGIPIRLPDIVNAHSAIYSPAVAADGSVYFNQPDPVTRKSHIYRAQRTDNGFLAPIALNISDGTIADFDVAVAPDESFIVFSSNRPPAEAQALIFISYAQRNHAWSAPHALQPSVEGLESRLSPDLKTLYFSTEIPSPDPAQPTRATISRIFQLPLHRH